MRGGEIAWGLGQAGPVEFRYADSGENQQLIQQGLDQAEYVDIHRWRFTPSSFALLVQDLRELGYHSLAEVDSAPTLGFEFFVTLGRRESPPRRDRLELLQQIRSELALVAEMDGLGPSLVAAEREIDDLREALASARGELDRTLSSRSWRATASLRRIAAILRGR
jgi:hypothetical protein